MTGNVYKSLADIESICTHGIPEGVTLEYKASSSLISKTNVSILCKTVTAFANSAGGQFVIGIESVGGKPTRLDGGVAGTSRRDWIFQTVSANTFPPVESLNILEFPVETGTYYVIDVPVSARAPHQADDKKYYKRRGSHSEPMEHYEIEDVRNRPRTVFSPLRVELLIDDIIGHLQIKNEHGSQSLQKLDIQVNSNFELESEGIRALQTRGLRELRPQTERLFYLGSISSMLQANDEAELHVSVDYDFLGNRLRESASFYLADLMHSSIVRSQTVTALRRLGEKIDKITNQLEKLRRDAADLTNISDGTGLRLSQRTIAALRGTDQRFDPREFDWDGYKIILDISEDDAIDLLHVFGVISSLEEKQKRYSELRPELRERFERFFKLPFTE